MQVACFLKLGLPLYMSATKLFSVLVNITYTRKICPKSYQMSTHQVGGPKGLWPLQSKAGRELITTGKASQH